MDRPCTPFRYLAMRFFPLFASDRLRFRRLNEFPKLRIVLEGGILTRWQVRAIKKVLQGVPVQDAVYHDPEFVPFKVDAVIAQAKTMQGFPVALQFPEPLQFSAHHLLRQAAKLAQNVQLKFLWHARQFGRARRIEDDLKRPHILGWRMKLWSIWIGSAYGNRTRLSALRGPCPSR